MANRAIIIVLNYKTKTTSIVYTMKEDEDQDVAVNHVRAATKVTTLSKSEPKNLGLRVNIVKQTKI